jgi:hypothetical protein
MPISLETQEIIFAFAADNKDNLESWGKYELDELQDAYAELPEEEIASTTGQRIKDRIEELESGHDQVKEAREEVLPDNPLDGGLSEKETQEIPIMPSIPETKTEEPKQKTPIIIAGIIIGVVILTLVVYFLK